MVISFKCLNISVYANIHLDLFIEALVSISYSVWNVCHRETRSLTRNRELNYCVTKLKKKLYLVNYSVQRCL